MSPPVILIRPSSRRASVDLPQPLSPTSPKVRPLAMLKVTLSTARTVRAGPLLNRRCGLKCLVRPSTSISATDSLASLTPDTAHRMLRVRPAQRWVLQLTALDCLGAAREEGTACLLQAQRGRLTLNRLD